MVNIDKNDFVKIVTNIKSEIELTRAKVARQVNSELIMMYFRIGKILHENAIDDIYFIKNVAVELKAEFPDLRGFGERNLRNMRQFYEEYKDSQTRQQAVAELSWGHNLVLMSKVKDLSAREVYIKSAIDGGWSRSMLERQIKTGYHKRIGNSTNNFKEVMAASDCQTMDGMLKDPYIFDFLTMRKEYKEKELENAMLERIRDVLLELGDGWSFIGNQYKLTLAGEDYFLDLLFYHVKLKCYVVVELKADKSQPEYAGKMNFYLTLVDQTLKSESDNPSIGLILCKDKNRLTAQYALRNVNSPIGVSSYETGQLLPENILDEMPSEEELNLHIDVGVKPQLSSPNFTEQLVHSRLLISVSWLGQPKGMRSIHLRNSF